VKKLSSRDLSARNQGLKSSYAYKPKVHNVKEQGWNVSGTTIRVP
jgi:hypothetical protein